VAISSGCRIAVVLERLRAEALTEMVRHDVEIEEVHSAVIIEVAADVVARPAEAAGERG
jgi:hypothetical protein